jgi:hypothetical protein
MPVAEPVPQVTRYPRRGDPPELAGGVKATVADPGPGVTETIVGADGRDPVAVVEGVAFEAFEAALAP